MYGVLFIECRAFGVVYYKAFYCLLFNFVMIMLHFVNARNFVLVS